MTIYIILISIVIVSLGIIAFILIRKLSKIKILNIDTVPEELTIRAKDRILIERMKRQSKRGRELVKKNALPVLTLFGGVFQKIKKKLYELEEKYKKESNGPQVTGRKLQNQIKQMIEQSNKLADEEKYSEAEKKYIEIISLDSKNIDAYKGLSDVYLKMKELKQALQTSTFVLQLENKRSQLINKKDEFNQVIQTVSNAHEIADACSDVGYIYQLMDQYQDAKLNYEKALQFEPNNPRNLDQMINICFMTKDKNYLVDLVARLEQVNPDNQKLLEYKEKILEM